MFLITEPILSLFRSLRIDSIGVEEGCCGSFNSFSNLKAISTCCRWGICTFGPLIGWGGTGGYTRWDNRWDTGGDTGLLPVVFIRFSKNCDKGLT